MLIDVLLKYTSFGRSLKINGFRRINGSIITCAFEMLHRDVSVETSLLFVQRMHACDALYKCVCIALTTSDLSKRLLIHSLDRSKFKYICAM